MPTKYVSTTGSNGNNGNTESTPYQTFAYAIGQLNNGDTLLFKRGDVFPAPDYIAKQINIGAYGTGALPEISGFVTASGWVDEGSGVWSFTDAGLPTLLNVVSFNGVFRPRVRFSKNGYRTIQSHTGTNYGTITNNTIPNSPSLVGAEIVIRKRRWVLDRAVITNHANGGILTYAELASNHALTYEPFNGYGFFIQNHSSVMTELGDWRFDGTAKKLYMYFGAENPTSHVVKLSKTARAFHTGDSGGGVYSDIHVTGFNQWAWSSIAAGSLIQGVKFSMIGEFPLYTSNVDNINFNTCVFEDIPNSCIIGDGNCNGWSVMGCTFRRVHHWHGAGGSNDGTKGIAVAVFGNNLNVQFNNLSEIGYEGIFFKGNGSTIDNNKCDTFGYVKDDGGAIYSFEGNTGTTSFATKRTVRNNIITNGIGTIDGTNETELKAFGIYLDEKTPDVDVEGNMADNCSMGIFLHNAKRIRIRRRNLFHKNLNTQIGVRTLDAGDPTVGIEIENNIMVGSKLVIHDSAHSSNTAWGSADNNTYFSDSATPFTTRINDGAVVNQSFTNWKSVTGKDTNSTLAPAGNTQAVGNGFNNVINFALTNPGTNLITKIPYNKSITLGPYQSEVLSVESNKTRIPSKQLRQIPVSKLSNNETSLLDFGAYGDNVNVDTIPLRNALRNSSVLNIPAGTYKVEEIITLNNASNLLVKGVPGTKITSTSLRRIINLTGDCTNVTFMGIEFESTLSSPLADGSVDVWGLFTTNEAKINGLRFLSCKFSAPNCSTQGLKILSETVRSERIVVYDCDFTNIGRMGIEFQDHSYAGAWKIANFNILCNRFNNTGTVSEFGMAISLSGQCENGSVIGNDIKEAKVCGLEIAGCRNITCSVNVFSTVTKLYFPISCSNANGNLGGKNINITGSTFQFDGKLNCKVFLGGMDGYTFSNNTGTITELSVNSSNGTFSANVLTTNLNYSVFIANGIRNNFSTNHITNVGTENYAVFAFSGASTDNTLTGNHLKKGTGGHYYHSYGTSTRNTLVYNVEFDNPGTLRYGSITGNGVNEPTWTTPGASDPAILTRNANYTITNSDETVLGDASGGAIILTLPATPTTGKKIWFKKIDSTYNQVQIAGNGKTIDGAPSLEITIPMAGGMIQYNGTSWYIMYS